MKRPASASPLINRHPATNMTDDTDSSSRMHKDARVDEELPSDSAPARHLSINSVGFASRLDVLGAGSLTDDEPIQVSTSPLTVSTAEYVEEFYQPRPEPDLPASHFLPPSVMTNKSSDADRSSCDVCWFRLSALPNTPPHWLRGPNAKLSSVNFTRYKKKIARHGEIVCACASEIQPGRNVNFQCCDVCVPHWIHSAVPGQRGRLVLQHQDLSQHAYVQFLAERKEAVALADNVAMKWDCTGYPSQSDVKISSSASLD